MVVPTVMPVQAQQPFIWIEQGGYVMSEGPHRPKVESQVLKQPVTSLPKKMPPVVPPQTPTVVPGTRQSLSGDEYFLTLWVMDWVFNS